MLHAFLSYRCIVQNYWRQMCLKSFVSVELVRIRLYLLATLTHSIPYIFTHMCYASKWFVSLDASEFEYILYLNTLEIAFRQFKLLKTFVNEYLLSKQSTVHNTPQIWVEHNNIACIHTKFKKWTETRRDHCVLGLCVNLISTEYQLVSKLIEPMITLLK